jgi:hypothetical protein
VREVGEAGGVRDDRRFVPVNAVSASSRRRQRAHVGICVPMSRANSARRCARDLGMRAS